MTHLIVARASAGETMRFASAELARYLRRMDRTLLCDERVLDREEDGAPERQLLLRVGGRCERSSLDDAFSIEITAGCGSVDGSNERAVLLGVYRLLHEWGCRFLSPEEEIVPERTFSQDMLTARLAERASYRHRAVCIEGANTFEYVLHMIDWLPKAMMNGYFFQFRIPLTFFERWYSAHGLPMDYDGAHQLHTRLVEELERRGLLYHAVGHGWTCEPFGIPGGGWMTYDREIAPGVKALFAEVDGRRELWHGVALETNLCYSNPEVRRKIARAIAEYCKENPAVNYLHFWLSDGRNNFCECPACRGIRPADHYVMLLNEADAALQEAGVDTKIVFLLYFDLLWEPERERLRNPDRFVLMFAPITRTYSRPFCAGAEDSLPETAPYVRNRLTMPKSVEMNVAHLRRWQKQFSGDSFDFDYHLMWDHINDPGYYACAEILFEDMKNLNRLGLNGMVSCQLQRVGFPNWFPLHVMSRALWNRDCDFEEMARAYFADLYGADGEWVRAYLRELSARFDPPYLRQEKEQQSAESAQRYRALPAFILEKKPFLSARAGRGLQWRKLNLHADLCILLAHGLEARASGSRERADAFREALLAMVRANEALLGDSLDFWNFERMMKKRI